MSKRQTSKASTRDGGSVQKRSRRSDKVEVDWDEKSVSDTSEAGDFPESRRQHQEEQQRQTVKESSEEVRVRLARDLLGRLQTAKDREDPDSESEEEESEDDYDDPSNSKLDAVSRKLHRDLLEKEGRLRRPIAAELDVDLVQEVISSRAHRFAITCVALSDAEDFCYTASKDCNIIRWDVETGRKTAVIKGKRNGDPEDGHTDQVLALALTSDGRYLASGGKDKLLRIWDCRTNTLIDTFQGHRDSISGLVFRKGTHTLYSSSHDRSVRAWNIDEMAFIESLFGHQGEINAVDCLRKERAISCGLDKTLRFWKIPEETQLLLEGKHNSSIDCVKMIDETTFVSGCQDGTVALWTTNRKKPNALILDAHEGSWVSSVAALPNSDLIATGGSDGFVRLWRVDLDSMQLNTPEIGKLKVPGFVNSLAFSPSGRILVAGAGQEHRLGSWKRDHSASNRLHIFKLDSVGLSGSEVEDDGAEEDDEDASDF
eukprot:CAMPEP_0184550836 /NCGR_PEP_ID=MMETSP0199_2-20130426/22296_1 /TAXON_ID=1112570 /ORGANISM="Thraustochytrium sp., Strain LLF1b" /LENGTH=485 /DNA_ID=CAMNT_0026945823 /DNA_START=17 /DNA_END=1474 /DNA_ORIENTATION=-